MKKRPFSKLETKWETERKEEKKKNETEGKCNSANNKIDKKEK